MYAQPPSGEGSTLRGRGASHRLRAAVVSGRL